MNLDQMAKELTAAMQTPKKKTAPYDTAAEVRRIEGDTAWVHIPGGADETPVKMTINAKPGDTVQVRVSGGRAFMVGNATSPPTDDTRANQAAAAAARANQSAEAAKVAADSALSSAATASEAAAQAVEDAATASSKADAASTAASAAQTSADQAAQAAQAADTKATNAASAASAAQTSADQAASAASAADAKAAAAKTAADAAQGDATAAGAAAATAQSEAQAATGAATTAGRAAAVAQAAADAAITQLSVVEDVFGVLDLLSKNGNYQATPDESVEPDKWYFTRSGNGTEASPYIYTVANNITSVYHLTDDTAIDSTKTYYTRSGEGTEESPYVYTVVQNPVVGDISTYYEKYYELTGIDEAIQNYVSSHLALDGQGLWLQIDDGEGAKVLLSPDDGLVLYGKNGQRLGQYGETALVGDESGFHIEITATELGFYDETGTRVAYINNNTLHITQSVVLDEMQLGSNKWSWKYDASDESIYLKWIG